LPYDNSDKADVIANIRLGKRPPRPTDPSQNQWLQDRIWDTITTCWSDKPEQRYELSVVYRVFSEYGQREDQDVEQSNLNTHRDRDLKISDIETGQQQRGGFLPRIASLFQFLRESEPEIERSVGEMDKAGFPPPPPLLIPRLTRDVAS
jgi:hypothetical protein